MGLGGLYPSPKGKRNLPTQWGATSMTSLPRDPTLLTEGPSGVDTGSTSKGAGYTDRKPTGPNSIS